MTNVDIWSMTNVDIWSMTNVDIRSMTNVILVNDKCTRDLWDICTSLGAVNDKCRHIVNDKCRHMINDKCIRDLWDICTSLGAVNDKCRHMVNDKCKHGQWTQQKLAGCDLDLMPFCQLHVSLTGCKIFTIVIDWVYTISG